MGLAMLELVMDLEDEFQIQIPNEEVVAETLGQLYDVVLRHVKQSAPESIRHRPDLEAFVWSRVAALSRRHSGAESLAVTRETHFVRDLGYG